MAFLILENGLFVGQENSSSNLLLEDGQAGGFIDIRYNGNYFLTYLSGQPLPLVSQTNNMVRYSEKWATQVVTTLKGSLTGCSYNSILAGQTNLLNFFNIDFQDFNILQDNKTLFEQKYNIIRDISFESSKYVGILPYSVVLETYPEQYFSGQFGIINPTNEWSYTETEDRILEVTHQIGCKGFQTSHGYSNALDNAKNYVLSKTGLSTYLTPYFINYCSGASPCLVDYSENINRFDGSYQVNEKYILDLFNVGTGTLRYTTEYNCDLTKGVASVSVNGEVSTYKSADLNTLRAKYSTFNIYNSALEMYSGVTNRIDLNPEYLSSGISENQFNKKITFNVLFDNDFSPKTFFDYTTSVRKGEDDIISVNVNGAIKGRGDLKNRWARVSGYYTQLNLFALAQQGYSDFGETTYPLNNNQINYSTTFNQFAAEIDVSALYDNKDILPYGLRDLDYSISIKPAIQQLRSSPLVYDGSACNASWSTVDLGFKNRASLSIKGKTVGDCNSTQIQTVSNIKGLVNNLLLQYYTNDRVVLEQNQLTTTNQNKGLSVDFGYAWSFKPSNYVTTVNQYDTINTLTLK